MAISQASKMQSSLRCSFYLFVLWVAGINSSTLRLHPEQRYMLPQNRGFFTVEANEDLADGGGGGAAAPALPLAAHSAAEGGSDYGAHPQHRSRRSTGESTLPKVYGQVKKCISALTTLLSQLRMLCITLDLPLAGKDVLKKLRKPQRC